jgi:hypothetical protein
MSCITSRAESCVITFESDDDMDKAIEVITYNSDYGFTGIGEHTIEVNKQQCQMLKDTNNINYTHIK